MNTGRKLAKFSVKVLVDVEGEIMNSEFADDFKALFPDLMRREFGDKIKEDIRDFRENVVGLRENSDYHKALKRIVELIMTNSWWRPLSRDNYKKFERQFSLYHSKFGDDGFRTRDGKRRLLDIVERFATSNRGKAVQKVSNLIGILDNRNDTIRAWTENLYNLARNGETEIFGDKGRDNYLRDFGYFDRAPMRARIINFGTQIRYGGEGAAQTWHDAWIELEKSELKKYLGIYNPQRKLQYNKRIRKETIDWINQRKKALNL